MTTKTFYADAVLFDMDGTLTDSIAAVEAAWGKVARDIGQDPQKVIAATHGKRAVDNLQTYRKNPELPPTDIDAEVQAFEETILFFADAYNRHGPGSQPASAAATPLGSQTPLYASGAATPSGSQPPSRSNSMNAGRRPSFATNLATKLAGKLSMSTLPEDAAHDPNEDIEDDEEGFDPRQPPPTVKKVRPYNVLGETKEQAFERHELEAWQLQAASVDRSVQILPGVRRLMDSIPAGRYAVATSGAKTYAYGCMTRVGITPPPVTITADDKRLKAGKPAPDPFLLAAECLGFPADKCVVFEDSPSGIRAGVAAGSTVIALCTSHERSKIENCGAHYIVENMERVTCTPEGNQLKFTVTL